MSHHLDSPASRRDPRLNVTDVYAFDSNDATVLAMIVNSSLAGADRIAGFHPEGRYEFKIGFDGTAAEQLTYRFSFAPTGASGAQHVAIDRLPGTKAGDDRATGARIAEGHTGEAISGSGLRAWCGAAADPFYLDLHHLAHILEGLQNELPIENGEWTPAQAASTFTGSQICAIVLEIPHSDTEVRPGRPIGVWAAAKLATNAGGWRQINRAGIPMMWPLFRALGGDDDSAEYHRDTTAQPADDQANDPAASPLSWRRRCAVPGSAIRTATAVRSLPGSCPMSCRTGWAPARRSPSPVSTAVRWPTTRRR